MRQIRSRALEYWDPDYRYSWLIPEFAQTLAQELDFTQEARNAERAGEHIGYTEVSAAEALRTLTWTPSASSSSTVHC